MYYFDFSNVERVQNQMNQTNLEIIRIKGLFGRYKVEIPFEQQVNIYIGENGLGKTTILNCIYYILMGQYTKLLNIQFDEIQVKFKNNSKTYSISYEDIREYCRKDDIWFQHRLFDVDLSANDNYILDNEYWDYKKKSVLEDYYENRFLNEIVNNKRSRSRKGIKPVSDRVTELKKAIEKNITNRIIYLPTYRRIEDDFSSLNLRDKESNETELLIRFGMSDVQNHIEKMMKEIQSLAMKGFNEMTGVLLKQYADGEEPSENKQMYEKMDDIDIEIIKIVLDRVGDEIEEGYKIKILNLFEKQIITKNHKYAHLLNLIQKLIDNYGLQKAYDDRIKMFVETCNKYFNDKFFVYNQSTLRLDIFLENVFADTKETIDLTQLSSGEKQIVSLFSRLYLESDKPGIVIIDEPELSLSMQWQKMLLPDIMRTNKCDLLITVTHSPFVFNNEFDYDAKAIRDYIQIGE